MMLNKLAIIQARMSSSRLPGKVMLDITGKPMLQHVIERARAATLVDQVVLATTIDPSDDVLQDFCQAQGIACFRGSLSDVLDRYYQAAAQFHADVIIRLTADCPLLDPELIDLTVRTLLGQPLPLGSYDSTLITNSISSGAYPYDFTSNRLPPPWQRTLPIGLDVEVCTMNALQQAWRQADQAYQREHVMPYLYEGVEFDKIEPPARAEWYLQRGTTKRGIRVSLLNHIPDYGSLRWTVDTQADLDFVRRVYVHLEGQVSYSWKQVLALLERQPEMAAINAEVKHKSAFDVDKRASDL